MFWVKFHSTAHMKEQTSTGIVNGNENTLFTDDKANTSIESSGSR